MSALYEAPMTRAGLTRTMDLLPQHLRPILTAVRDHRVGMLFVPQEMGAFKVPARSAKPAIMMIGDDLETAMGPSGFDTPSLEQAVQSCALFVVVASAASAELYGSCAAAVVKTRASAMLIETRPEREIEWMKLIQKLAPGRPICLSTVTGGHS